MDLLAAAPRPRARRLGLRLLLLATATIAGCAVFSMFAPAPPLAFPHARHLQEGLECDACHADWQSSDQPGMPVAAACKLCHDGIDADKPADRKIGVLFDGDTYRAAHLSRLPAEVVFSHQKHANAKLDCKTCHVGIDTSTRIDRSVAVDMDDCRRCHQQQGKPAECATCHREVRADRPPRTHEFHWLKLHGKTVRAHSEQRVDDCSMCHTETTCVSCHHDTPPENHDNYFRRRAHGLYARMDRDNCSACHRSDSCDQCHRETRPLNHAGAFGGTVSNHCLSCHFPLASNDCVTCHRSTPSHAQATPLPPSHNPGMNCRMCHGNGQPLPHVDKGDTCTTCHR